VTVLTLPPTGAAGAAFIGSSREAWTTRSRARRFPSVKAGLKRGSSGGSLGSGEGQEMHPLPPPGRTAPQTEE